MSSESPLGVASNVERSSAAGRESDAEATAATVAPAPRQVRLAIANVESEAGAPADRFIGDYVLDLVAGAGPELRWEFNFPSSSGLFEAELTATPIAGGGLGLRARLPGAQQGPEWSGETREFAGPTLLRYDVANVGRKIGDCYWPSHVCVTPLPVVAARRFARPSRRDAPRSAERMAVITCHFNPCGYAKNVRNYRRFCQGLRRQGVSLFAIECAFGDAPFALRPSDNLWQTRTRDVMWLKERLLNRALAKLPAQYDKVAWVDADVLFANGHWLDDAARLLDEFPVVQVFEEVTLLDRFHRPAEGRYGVARVGAANRSAAKNLARSHPGFGWAARREILVRHGLFDRNIVGCGDGLMVYAMYGWWDHPFLARYNGAMRAAFERWGRPFHESVGGRVGYVPGAIRHLWHGARADRRYVERIRYLTDHDFDPATDIAPAENGLWRWATDKPTMHAAVRNYFHLRQEDR